VQYSTHGASFVASWWNRGSVAARQGTVRTRYLQGRVAMSSVQVNSEGEARTAEAAVVDMKLEVVVIPRLSTSHQSSTHALVGGWTPMSPPARTSV
jgi:hypothetical protein